MRRVISCVPGVVFALTAASLLAGIVVLAANGQSYERGYQTNPGAPLIVIRRG